MTDLASWLLQQIADDERLAQAASPAPWQYFGVDSVAGGMLYDTTRTIASLDYEQREDHDGRIVRHLLEGEADANGDHITRWHPARVLAECEAKRRIVELHEDSHECSTYDSRGEIDNCTWVLNAAECSTLRLLALPYVDRPAYDESWRP